MYVGTLSFDLLLGDVRSLKEKRSVVRPIVAELHRKYAVSVAEVGEQNLHRRATIGLAWCPGTRGTSQTYWTAASAWSPHGPKWSCCRYGGGSTATMTTERVVGATRTMVKDTEGDGPVADNARAKKLADLIREVVAQKLQRGIKDRGSAAT